MPNGEKALDLIVICPVCFSKMIINSNRYLDEQESDSPLAECPDCGFIDSVENLENDDLREKITCYQLRLLLGQIVQGERAKELINLHPLFPYSRSKQLVALMENSVPPSVDFLDEKLIPPLSSEDIETVKKVLNL
ncbi:MAG: hypothetical protein Q7K65_04665 [Candidatus Buchananbacteria bacterium]|nr:hypothetical protein [Candidatus Buchananbacteria bacterium]